MAKSRELGCIRAVGGSHFPVVRERFKETGEIAELAKTGWSKESRWKIPEVGLAKSRLVGALLVGFRAFRLAYGARPGFRVVLSVRRVGRGS